MERPVLFWIDMLAGSRSDEPPPRLLEQFAVRSCTNVNFAEKEIAASEPACIFFDFDYPDRQRLSVFLHMKARFPSIPVVIMTLHSSESLGVWAFRNGALDYLVKPLKDDELAFCTERILKITKIRDTQPRRQLQLRKSSMPYSVPAGSRSTKQKLSPAVFFVQQHYHERISSDAVARLCGLTATYFSRAFSQTFDLTFQEFLLRFRISKACEMLDNPGANISDVSYAVGFTDPSYFARVFRRYAGATPSDYLLGKGRAILDLNLPVSEDSLTTSSSQVVRILAGSFQN